MDLDKSFEEFERIMEDYFWAYGPDLTAFKMDYVKDWTYLPDTQQVEFKFDSALDMEFFYDAVLECPKYQESFDIDWYDGKDDVNLTLMLDGKEGGL